MEESNIVIETSLEPKTMRIGEEDKSLLASSAKWANFISIVMLICYGLALVCIILWMIAVAVAGFSMYDITGMYGAAGAMYAVVMWPVMIFALVMYIVQMLPAIYLYRFAQKTREAVASNNEAAMTESFRNLRGSIKTTGIILIASIAFGILFSIAMVGWFAIAM